METGIIDLQASLSINRRIVSRLIDYFNFSNVTVAPPLMISIVLGKRSFNGANDRIIRLIVGRR